MASCLEELKYEYRAVAYNGIPGTSQIVSGVETNMTFLIKNFQEPNQMQLEVRIVYRVFVLHSKETFSFCRL